MLAKSPIRISPPNMPKIDERKAVPSVAARIMLAVKIPMPLA
jgi:hypothetical protein